MCDGPFGEAGQCPHGYIGGKAWCPVGKEAGAK